MAEGQAQGSQGGQLEPQDQQIQQPAPQQHQPPPVPPLQSTSSGDSSYRCQWVNCNEYHPSPEQLYEHVCDKHIGRKSTNNLNLQCAWGNCHVQVVKRDHITSHIRVHVPLKPHRCQFCGKTFKRPQDLKKHVKTHADDTVINGMNQSAQQNHQHPQNGGYNMGNQQHKAPSYYPDHHQMQPYPPPPMGYGQQGHGGPPNYYAPTQQHGGPGAGGYGTVSYSLGHGDVGNNSFDSGKSFANLNSFIGDTQRGMIDMKNYSQVSNRLVPLQNNGVQYLLGGGMADSQPAPQAHIDGGGVFGPTTAQYSLPSFDTLRTKDQLLDMARRFEQMASTVYDNADQVAAAGIGQPGATYVDSTFDYRNSQSPPSVQLTSSHNDSAMAAVSSQRSNHSGTPVLTPPSSAGGYASGHSPDSTHSNPRLSPATASGSVYPNLPDASSNGYHGNMASTAALGPSDHEYRPRHGGGFLQKAQPLRRQHEDQMDTSEDRATTPKNSTSAPTGGAQRAPVAPMQPKAKFFPSNIDPALSGGEQSSDGQSEKATTPKNSTSFDPVWVATIRTLDALRKYVRTRLQNHEYDDAHEEKQSPQGETPGLYPTLKGVEVEG